MRRLLPHLTCHTVVLCLLLAAALTGYAIFVPAGILIEIIFWIHAIRVLPTR